MADEKIKIASFEIDTDDLIKGATEVKSRIDQLAQANRDLTKAGQSSSEEFVRNASQLRELRREYNSQVKVLGEVASATGKLIPLEHEVNSIMARETKTMNDLRKQNSDLTKARNNLNIRTEEGRKALEAINTRINENNNLIKSSSTDFEQARLSVGSYSESIKDAFGQMGIFGETGQRVKVTVDALKNATSTARKNMQNLGFAFDASTNISQKMVIALKALRVALIATGIGAIVVALGAMVAYLQGTVEGVNKLNRVLVPLKSVLSGVLGVIQELGGSLIDAFKNPREFIDNLMDALRPLGTLLEGIFTFDMDKVRDGYSGVREQVTEIANQTREWYEAGQRIQALNEEIEASELRMIANRGKLGRELEKQREISRDAGKTAQERNEASQKAIDLANELKDLELDHLDLKIKKLKEEQALSGNTHADNVALAELEAERDEREASHSRLMSRLTNRLNRSADLERKNADDARKKQQDADRKRIQSMNEELELMKAQESFREKTLIENLEFEQSISDRKIEILNAELESKIISQQKYESQVLEIQRDLAKRQAEISVENANAELKNIENRQEIERELSEAVGITRLEEEQKRLEEIREARARYEFIRFQEGLSNENDYQEAINEINKEFTISQSQIAKERADLLSEIAKQKRELDFEAEMIAVEERGEKMFELEELRIEQQRELALEEARSKYQDEVLLQQAIANINAESANAIKAINIEKDNVILDSKLSLLDATAQILGEETILGKAAAITAATINTYQGATKALATLPPPASYIAATATTIQGLAAVGKIAGITGNISKPNVNAGGTATPEQTTIALNAIPPFAKGGKVVGGIPIQRSNGDNVLATLRVGEVVLNEGQQRALGGDAVFRSLGVPGFANGGRVGDTANIQRMISGNIDSIMIDSISNAVMKGAKLGTEVGSRQGITDRSTETYLRNISTF